MMDFTKSQTTAIEERGQNILVSAAAGSGKTAVLVERIIRAITREEDPIDIDRILVMTFTKAAAGEMRERIMKAVNERLKKSADTNLYRQAALIHNAHISTIHGFCLDVIKNHFHRIDLSPDFRTMDEAEGKLLMADVLEEVLEEAYEAGEERFLAMSEKISSGKSDQALQDAILKLFKFAVSNADIEAWFDTCESMYAGINAKDFDKHPIVKARMQGFHEILDGALSHAQAALAKAEEPDGPYMYADAITSDIEMIEALQNAAGYADFATKAAGYNAQRLGSARKDGPAIDPDKKDLVKSMRDEVKKTLQDLQTPDLQCAVDDMVKLMQSCEADVKALISVTRRFYEKFQEEKRRRGLIDFNDMEHLCLKILTENPAIAGEYRDFFEEIYVDEYQDSNFVQEAIVNVIANDNVFNVGDVKQSIYRFRMGRPDLFLKKYEQFKAGKGGMRVDLQENFRSRIEVIDAVNEVFAKIMQENPCGMVYDAEAALKYGSDYYDKARVIESAKITPQTTPEDPQNDKNIPVTNGDYENITQGSETSTRIDQAGRTPYVAEYVGIVKDPNVDAKELEAAYIAERILDLIESKMPVYDKQLEGLRPVRYSDIVILLRATSGWDEKFCSVISGFGIPIHTASATGYFFATEIVWLLSYLQVIDNPLQDIPLATVLLSPIGKLSDTDLATIRAAGESGDKKDKNRSLYQDLCRFAENPTDAVNTGVIEKIIKFMTDLDAFREKAVYTSVYEILQEIVDGDYGREILARKGGKKAYANLNMLLSKALEFEQTSYRGLFQFVRYIEYLKKNEIDYGEANLLGEHDNTVRLMSIHKSKGLEFPVVFLAATHKEMNFMDARASLVLDPDLGIGMAAVDLERRTKTQTISRAAISRKILRENLAEEIRILYVGMTRAREKLIMTGMCKDGSAPLGKRVSLLHADSYQELLGCAMDDDGLFAHIKIKTATVADLIRTGVEREVSLETSYQAILKQLKAKPAESTDETSETQPESTLAEKLHFTYPVDVNDCFGKISVSELKKRSMQVAKADGSEDDDLHKEIKPDRIVPMIPDFLEGEEKEVSPTLHGTAFHRLLEIWDYNLEPTEASVEAFFKQTAQDRRMEDDLLKIITVEEITTFLKTDIAARMRSAALKGDLYREQPFVIRAEHDMLVQGIIDAYFIEDGQIVVVDYKTDRVKKPETLVDRYKVQLDYYAKALQQLCKMPVKEKIIYSAVLNETIPITD